MTSKVRDMGMEVCATLGMLDGAQAKALREAGLTAYNHNLDTSPEFYPKVTSSRNYEDRLNTIAAVRDAGISVCCGGILGLGALYTLVPIRPRWRGERRSLRTFPGVSLRPLHAFNLRARRLSTPTDAFQLHPDRCAPSPSRGSSCRARWFVSARGESRWIEPRRQCASSPAPTPCSPATRC